jgi:tetratricopeptide (TPR) repeat protein
MKPWNERQRHQINGPNGSNENKQAILSCHHPSPPGKGYKYLPPGIRGGHMKLAIIIILALAATFISPALADYTAEYWSNQGDQYFTNGSFELAAASYDKALELEPEHIALLDNKGSALANLGRYEEAIMSFDRALEINSSSAESHCLKGLALSQGMGRNDDGLASLEKALQINPKYYDAWTGKGMALANNGKLEDALSCFQNASLINPQNPQGWNNQGVVLKELGRYEDAVSCFERALVLDPSYEIAAQNKELAQQDLGQQSSDDDVQSMSHII